MNSNWDIFGWNQLQILKKAKKEKKQSQNISIHFRVIQAWTEQWNRTKIWMTSERSWSRTWTSIKHWTKEYGYRFIFPGFRGVIGIISNESYLMDLRDLLLTTSAIPFYDLLCYSKINVFIDLQSELRFLQKKEEIWGRFFRLDTEHL